MPPLPYINIYKLKETHADIIQKDSVSAVGQGCLFFARIKPKT